MNEELIKAFEELLVAAVEYHEYEWDGDPWTEDARAMGEMILDNISAERFKEYKTILARAKSG